MIQSVKKSEEKREEIERWKGNGLGRERYRERRETQGEERDVPTNRDERATETHKTTHSRRNTKRRRETGQTAACWHSARTDA